MDKKIASNHYKSADAVIEAGLRALREREAEDAKKVEGVRREIQVVLDRGKAKKSRKKQGESLEEMRQSLEESSAEMERGEGLVVRDTKVFAKAFIAEMHRRHPLKRGAAKNGR